MQKKMFHFGFFFCMSKLAFNRNWHIINLYVSVVWHWKHTNFTLFFFFLSSILFIFMLWFRRSAVCCILNILKLFNFRVEASKFKRTTTENAATNRNRLGSWCIRRVKKKHTTSDHQRWNIVSYPLFLSIKKSTLYNEIKSFWGSEILVDVVLLLFLPDAYNFLSGDAITTRNRPKTFFYIFMSIFLLCSFVWCWWMWRRYIFFRRP